MTVQTDKVSGLPDTTLSVRQVFGIDSDMVVPAYSQGEDHVPDLDPDYLFGVEDPTTRGTYARLTQPILSLSFTDDEYLSKRNIESLHAFYAGAAREMRRLAPAEVGAERIGHFGFFRRRHSERLWPLALDWLAARS